MTHLGRGFFSFLIEISLLAIKHFRSYTCSKELKNCLLLKIFWKVDSISHKHVHEPTSPKVYRFKICSIPVNMETNIWRSQLFTDTKINTITITALHTWHPLEYVYFHNMSLDHLFICSCHRIDIFLFLYLLFFNR